MTANPQHFLPHPTDSIMFGPAYIPPAAFDLDVAYVVASIDGRVRKVLVSESRGFYPLRTFTVTVQPRCSDSDLGGVPLAGFTLVYTSDSQDAGVMAFWMARAASNGLVLCTGYDWRA